jgi:hypothetical protein
MQARLRHCAAHLAMLVACVALYAAAGRIDASVAGPDRLGPDVWPKAIIIVMGLVCLYEIARRALFGTRPAEDAAEPTSLAAAGEPDEGAVAGAGAPPPKPRTLLLGASLIGAYVAAVPWLGFFLASMTFLAAFGFVGGFRRHGWNALVALVGALLLFVTFTRVAYVSLPMGEGPFRELSIWLMRLIGVH